MTRLIYDDAVGNFDHTEIGYSLASQDKVWIVFTFDLFSEGDQATLKYNRLYPLLSDIDAPFRGNWSYDLFTFRRPGEGGVVVFTSRPEAEHFAKEVDAYLTERQTLLDGYEWPDAEGNPKPEKPEVYVMNLGDDARHEKTVIGADGGTHPRTTPKFKGSERAWAALVEMGQRWAEANAGVLAGDDWFD